MTTGVTTSALLCLLALSTSATWGDDYHLSRWRYSIGDDLFAAVWDEFHDSAHGAVVADWSDILQTCKEAGACTKLADEVIGREAALVLRDGKTYCPSGRYFVSRSDEPPRFHWRIDRVPHPPLWLLCGQINGRFLAKLRDLDQPAGLVAPDWTLYLSHLRWFAPRRVRDISARLVFYGFSPDGGLLWQLEEYQDRPK